MLTVSSFISNRMKPKLVWTIFKNSVRTAKKTPHFTVTKIDRLTLFKEIIAVYSENHTKPIKTLRGHNAELVTAKACGISTYHWLWKGQYNKIRHDQDGRR
jgi:uncharacterized protein YktB (UPF0637 family)